MTKPEPIDDLLADLMQEMAKAVPEEAEAMAEYRRLVRASQEVDANGNPTKEAHRAKTRLNNPFLIEETPKRSRAKAQKQERETHAKMAKDISAAVKSWALWYHHRSKIEVLDAHDEHRLPARGTREEHDPESMFSLGYPLLEALAKEKVSPSSFGRLPTFAMKFIADLIKAHARDPKLKDPSNPWSQIVRSGVLAAYHGELPEEERTVIAYAASSRDEQASEWAIKARADLGLPAGFSQNFLEGAARLADAANELTAGEAAAYNHAYGLQITRDVELLGRFLALDPRKEGPQLTALVNFFTNVRRTIDDDLRFTIQLVAMKQAINAIGPDRKLKRDWVAELMNELPALAANLADSVDSIEAFDALLRHGLRCSDAAAGFAARAESKKQKKFEAELAVAIREACEAGTTFKIANGQVVWMEDLQFGEIDAEEWTAERWTDVHGAFPERATTDAEGASKMIPAMDREGEGDIADAGYDEVRLEAVIGHTPGTESGTADDEVVDYDQFDWQDETPDLEEVRARLGLKAASRDTGESDLTSASPPKSDGNPGDHLAEGQTTTSEAVGNDHEGADYTPETPRIGDDEGADPAPPSFLQENKSDCAATRHEDRSGSAVRGTCAKAQRYERTQLDDLDDEDLR